MPIKTLEHYNVLTLDLTRSVDFYVGLLGMRRGAVPGMDPNAGAWICDAADRPVVHIQAVDPAAPEAALGRVRERLGPLAGELDAARLQGSAALEHVAFECDDYDSFTARFEAAHVPIRCFAYAGLNFRQICLNDPNGITIELNFRDGA